MKNYTIKTQRLGLRNWNDNDLIPFAKMCADERVMEFFPNTLTKGQTNELIKRMQQHFEKYGYCYFAVDRLDNQEFIGFIGLLNQSYESHFTPCVDIGWRLAPKSWGNGFATEGAKACLDFAFNTLNLSEIYSVAPIPNEKSQNVMKKIGMSYHSTFIHPNINKSNPLSECAVYKVQKEDLQNFS